MKVAIDLDGEIDGSPTAQPWQPGQAPQYGSQAGRGGAGRGGLLAFHMVGTATDVQEREAHL